MRKNLLIAAAIVPALLLAGCGGGKKKTDESAQGSRVRVRVEPSRVEKVARTVDFTAELQAYLDHMIMPAIAARIDRIYVDVGDKVKEGQLLVDLDKTQYNTYRLQLANAESTLSRMMPVYEAGGVAKQQIDELQTSISVLKETVANLESNLSFRSPIDGIVTARYYEDGQLYAMSPNRDQTVGILRVMQIGRLKASVAVPEQFFPYVYLKMPVAVSAELYPGEVFKGEVSRKSPAINQATRSFDVEVTIDNKSGKLRPGMFSRTAFNMAEVESVTVKDLAIQRQPGTNDRYVFVVEDGTAQRRNVVTGRQMGDRVEILSGVRQGEKVVTAGMSRLLSGAGVEIVED